MGNLSTMPYWQLVHNMENAAWLSKVDRNQGRITEAEYDRQYNRIMEYRREIEKREADMRKRGIKFNH